MTSVADRVTGMVEFPSGHVTIQAFLAQPAETDAQPAILLLHEWWGLTGQIKDLARRLADEGFVALAPDLYSRSGHQVTTDPREAGKLMESLSSQAALRDLNAAIQFLKAQTSVDGLRIGVIGLSMGGTFALMMATHNSEVRAAVSFYGKVPPLETFRFLLCPVLYHDAARDAWVTRREVDVLREGFAKYGKPGEVAVYADANHGFVNEATPAVYRADDAKRAWERTLAFLRRELG